MFSLLHYDKAINLYIKKIWLITYANKSITTKIRITFNFSTVNFYRKSSNLEVFK